MWPIQSSRPHFLAPLLEAGGAALSLVNTRSGDVLATRLELASDSATRKKGLLGRDGLAPAEALILAPCSAIHTCFMRFPIDVVFADRRGRVVGIRRSVPPWRIAAGLRGFAAIELASGAVDRLGIALGDQLAVV